MNRLNDWRLEACDVLRRYALEILMATTIVVWGAGMAVLLAGLHP